jgi:class 3 adenylate cyclase
MKKTAFLTILCIFSLTVIYIMHLYEWELFGWSRLLIAAPIVYAGFNFRRSGAIAIAMLLILAEGPLIVTRYASNDTFGAMECMVVAIIVSVVSVLFGHILRKERENSETLKQTYNLVQSMRKSIEEDSLLSTLESVFADRGKSAEVSTYLFGDDGALRPRTKPDGEPLPPGHLFYTVAEKRESMTSANPSQDLRLAYYGPESERENISQLAVFPLEYGGHARGVISIANSTDERFGKENVTYLTAIKQSVENTLDLGEKLRGRIQHELQRKKIRDTFSSYLSRTVAEEILKDPDRLDLGGEVRDVTIMFTEVTNFRELMGTVPPEELLARLNEFFSIAIDTVFEFNGTLDKFIGDNIMAFWGAPLAIPGCEHKAVACAQALHHKLASLNDGWERIGSQPFNVCIGINSGAVVAGNIGSIRRMEYTIIGDTVNTAARIKSLSKSKGIPILLGETTYLRVKDSIKIEQKIEASIKGKASSITVYQVTV